MSRVSCALVACAGLAASAMVAFAGPDVVVSTIGPTLTRYGTNNGITGYAMTTVSCNVGDAQAIWIDSTVTTNPQRNQHPVIGQQMYRLHDGKFEQIGLSWLKHGFCAADAPSCTNLVPGSAYAPNGSCDWLGRFATDTYSASLNAQQSNLGPRSEVNPVSGVFPYPYQLNWNLGGNCVYKRLQIANSDINPTTFPGARFFAEVHYIPTDEAADVRWNNASYRECSQTGQATSGNGCTSDGPGYNLAFPTNRATIVYQPAIMAWATIDPTVTLVAADIPNDGRVIVGAKVTDQGDGTWRYEYAVYNHNSDRGIGGFSIQKPATPAATYTDLGFHDVAYHSGEPYDGTDWAEQNSAASIGWSTTDHATNPNANAIRWSSLYNFRFTSNRPPVAGGAVTLGFFKPGLAGDPSSFNVTGLPVPSAPCRADFNQVSGVSVQDLFDYLAVYFVQGPAADFDNVAGVTLDDLLIYLDSFFAGC